MHKGNLSKLPTPLLFLIIIFYFSHTKRRHLSPVFISSLQKDLLAFAPYPYQPIFAQRTYSHVSRA